MVGEEGEGVVASVAAQHEEVVEERVRHLEEPLVESLHDLKAVCRHDAFAALGVGTQPPALRGRSVR